MTLLRENHLTKRRKTLATIGVALAMLLSSLDQSIVGTAMPHIVAQLHGVNLYAWVVTGYVVSSTIVLPISGKLGDMFGRKPFILSGMLGFLISSWLCGMSQNMVDLILFRLLQGLFGGILTASVFAVLADIFSREESAKMQGVFSGVFGFSVFVGPTLGGFISDHVGWRWVFFVNVPVGAVGILLVFVFLPFVRTQARWRHIDISGCLTLAIGIVPLLAALSLTSTKPWSSTEVMVLLGVAIIGLVAFIVNEYRTKNPIVPFELFHYNAFNITSIVTFFTSVAQFGSGIFIPLLYQEVLGVSATNSGALVTPMLLAMLVVGTPAGQLMVRMRRYRYLNTAGLALVSVGMFFLTLITAESSRWVVAAYLVIVGAGLGLLFPMSTAVVQAALPTRLIGAGTSMVQFWRMMGGSVGTAVLGTIFAHQVHQFGGNRTAILGALHVIFLTVSVVLAVGLVATFFLREVPLGKNKAIPESEQAT